MSRRLDSWRESLQGGSGRQAGNISADLLFISPKALDYRLQPRSQAIDSGDNADPAIPLLDLSGRPRITDGNRDGIPVIDMGAYEFAPGKPTGVCVLGPEVLVLDTPPDQRASLYRACVISAGSGFTVGPGQHVTFLAGRLVELHGGFGVEPGGTLAIRVGSQSEGYGGRSFSAPRSKLTPE